MQERITLYNDLGESYAHTVSQWIYIAAMTKDTIKMLFGMDGLDILQQLEDAGWQKNELKHPSNWI